MANPFFRFKQFTVFHDRCAMKVTTDACLFGAWVADSIGAEQKVIGKMEGAGSELKALDIGAGTGLLSLMVAQKVTTVIDAVEIDQSAAAQARENIAASPWKNNITIIQQDVLQWQTENRYNYIFSNPPFYQNELKSPKTNKNIAHHDEGLQFPDLLSFIKKHLNDDGSFFLLLPTKREKELESLLLRAGLFIQRKVLVQQTLKHPPFRVMIQGRCNKVDQILESVISIKNEAEAYTPAFVALLNDYYLYL